MTPQRTDRRRSIPAPLAACAVCAVAGAVLCLAAGRLYGFSADVDLIGLLRRPAPLTTLVFGLSGLLVALHGRPGGKNRLNRPPEKPHCGDSAEGR
ncbi:hypothetical protein [Embleya sp. NBC_00896]|uniref:hypothetical protein n=1 Tax=Embleya sp. NBC_00896 TaxID=2975961 RepID=UPI003866D7B9|nr:hypothetical protein OG928_17865 [Embleya sp. NBC_00896]